MKKVLRYKLNDMLKTIRSRGYLTEITTRKEIDATVVFEMDNGLYRILFNDYLIPIVEIGNGDIVCEYYDEIYFPRCGFVDDMEFRAKEYNRKLHLNNGAQDYINAIYFLDEEEFVEEESIDESLEKVIEEIEVNKEQLSLLEICERLQDKYDEVNSNLFLIE